MSDDSTKEMDGKRSDFERIMQRFDSIDARLTVLEEKAERAQMETKPIWEQALAAIVETRGELSDFRREMNLEMRIVHEDSRRARIDVEDLKDRIAQLESKPS